MIFKYRGGGKLDLKSNFFTYSYFLSKNSANKILKPPHKQKLTFGGKIIKKEGGGNLDSDNSYT